MKTGDNTAQADFEAVFSRHWSRVYGLLFRLVGEHAEAEDLALEVFLRYYQRPPLVAEQDKLGGWLYRVALRLGYNAMRAARRRRTYEASAGRHDMSANDSADAEGQLLQAEQRQQVRRVLAGMKSRSAQVLVLRHAGASYAEIAAVLKIAPGSVGTLLARAEADFRRRYEQLECGK